MEMSGHCQICKNERVACVCLYSHIMLACRDPTTHDALDSFHYWINSETYEVFMFKNGYWQSLSRQWLKKRQDEHRGKREPNPILDDPTQGWVQLEKKNPS